ATKKPTPTISPSGKTRRTATNAAWPASPANPISTPLCSPKPSRAVRWKSHRESPSPFLITATDLAPFVYSLQSSRSLGTPRNPRGARGSFPATPDRHPPRLYAVPVRKDAAGIHGRPPFRPFGELGATLDATPWGYPPDLAARGTPVCEGQEHATDRGRPRHGGIDDRVQGRRERAAGQPLARSQRRRKRSRTHLDRKFPRPETPLCGRLHRRTSWRDRPLASQGRNPRSHPFPSPRTFPGF